jgi:hypothetical protein
MIDFHLNSYNPTKLLQCHLHRSGYTGVVTVTHEVIPTKLLHLKFLYFSLMASRAARRRPSKRDPPRRTPVVKCECCLSPSNPLRSACRAPKRAVKSQLSYARATFCTDRARRMPKRVLCLWRRPFAEMGAERQKLV